MKAFFKLIFFIALCLGLSSLFLIWWTSENMVPIDLGKEKINFKVSKGDYITIIGKNLEKKGLIKSYLVFKYYVKFKKLGKTIKAGDYIFEGIVTVESIVQKLQKGIAISYKITIPEGLKLKETAEIIKNSKLIDAENSLKIILSLKPEDFGINCGTMEGILCPETYFYTENMNVKDFVTRMTDNFKKIIPENYEIILEKKGLKNLDELIILASIIEKEAKLDTERPLVASVFLNRLKKNIKFESCATVMFALGKWQERILNKDLQVASPYNTYIHKGLPPTAICSPGKSSIESIFTSPESNFYYFVTKGDNTGTHYFSETYNRHLNAVKKFKKNRKNN